MATKSDHRDEKAIAQVQCPRCRAWPGKPCFFKGEPTPVRHGRPFCHNERRAAWVEKKRETPSKTGIEAGDPNV